jgi:hypothetical protein
LYREGGDSIQELAAPSRSHRAVAGHGLQRTRINAP